MIGAHASFDPAEVIQVLAFRDRAILPLVVDDVRWSRLSIFIWCATITVIFVDSPLPNPARSFVAHVHFDIFQWIRTPVMVANEVKRLSGEYSPQAIVSGGYPCSASAAAVAFAALNVGSGWNGNDERTAIDFSAMPQDVQDGLAFNVAKDCARSSCDFSFSATSAVAKAKPDYPTARTIFRVPSIHLCLSRASCAKSCAHIHFHNRCASIAVSGVIETR
jgi:hypothetical protein